MQLLLPLLCLLATGLCERSPKTDGEGTLLGAPTDVQETNTAQYRQWAWDAVVHRLRNSSLFQSVPLKIVSAKSQVVAGVLHKLHILIGASKCRVNGGYHSGAELRADDCSQQLWASGPYELCQLEVWERPWMNSMEITDLKCSRVDKDALSKLAGSGDLTALGRAPSVGVIAVDGAAPIRIQLHSPAEETAFKAFQDFLSTYKKTYVGGKAEYTRRFQIFQNNQRLIREMQRQEKGSAVYGVTAFADLTPAEFRQQVLIPMWPLDSDLPEAETLPNDKVPPNWDWRQHNAVTPVKDQGCDGGLPSNAYEALAQLGGLETEKDYPYEGSDEMCAFNKSKSAVNVQGGIKIPEDEEQMTAWLHKNGPISIGINANPMIHYKHGIAYPRKCDPEELNHGVLIVGYGVTSDEKKEPFWIIKNSWGPHWGEAGYYRIFRGGGVCGLNRMATSAVL